MVSLTPMSQSLPTHITSDMHPYLMRLVLAYQPHSPIPSRQQSMESGYQLDGHCSIQGLTQQCGLDYKQELNKRR